MRTTTLATILMLLTATTALAAPKPECGIKTVGYRFEGTPGTTFQYAGAGHTVPTRGWIELLASKRATTYRVSDRDLSLEVWPANEFGIRTVPMDRSERPVVAEPTSTL